MIACGTSCGHTGVTGGRLMPNSLQARLRKVFLAQPSLLLIKTERAIGTSNTGGNAEGAAALSERAEKWHILWNAWLTAPPSRERTSYSPIPSRLRQRHTSFGFVTYPDASLGSCKEERKRGQVPLFLVFPERGDRMPT